jgi:valyl-tRNA synthetase
LEPLLTNHRFLSEELWQRLPRRPGDQTPSITIAAYPEYNEKLEDPEAEAAYEVVLGASKAVRSLMSEYRMDQGKLFVQATDKATYEIVINQVQAIRSLSGKGVASVNVLSPTEPSPTGCAVYVVSSTLSVFLEVRGRVNVDEEITKAQAKMQKASEAVTKQRKVLDAEDFQSKVSEAVQEEERKRLREALAAQENYERSIQQFEKLKLET